MMVKRVRRLDDLLQNGVVQPKPVISDRLREVLRAIWIYFQENRRYPSFREILALVDPQVTNPQPWINGLVKAGMLMNDPNAVRRRMRFTRLGLEELERMGQIETTDPQLELQSEEEEQGEG